jgi:hypothetical protein
MEKIIIYGTKDTPTVLLDKENGKFEITGNSLPENVIAFYMPLIDWLERYTRDPNPSTIFLFNMNYFNSASSKAILNILNQLEKLNKTGKEIEVIWRYVDIDEDMLESGKDFAEIVKIPFKFIAETSKF